MMKSMTHPILLTYLQVLRKAVQHRADRAFFDQHYSYERGVMQLVEHGKKQMTIDQFCAANH